ncbi:hypothetical protein KJ766_02305 [Patescibacteria group bacterium]|nr:hypothetical protein [Patescibacteria group bacterium]
MINLNDLPNHERDEKTQLFLRRHWIIVVGITLNGVLFALLPILFYVALKIFDFPLSTGSLANLFIAMMLCVYIIFVCVILMTQFTDYYLDTWIVTNSRIINIEQMGLFSRAISELRLHQIQDVTSEMHGVLQTFFTYGNVFIQTAAAKERFNFKTIDDPEIVKEKIIRLTEAEKRKNGMLK